MEAIISMVNKKPANSPDCPVYLAHDPPKFPENVLCWFSGLSDLENNILKANKNCITGSDVKKMEANGYSHIEEFLILLINLNLAGCVFTI